MDLSGALQNPGSLFTQDSAESAVPDYIEAKVVEVVNGETIVVDVDGVRQSIRYLGIQAPTDNDCFAGEATAANASLVEGQTVRIERQSTNVDPRGNWVRDVWTPTQDGRYQMVSALLVSEGAATANISEPNTRLTAALPSCQVRGASSGTRAAARYRQSSTPPWHTRATVWPAWAAATRSAAATQRA